ncbi:manganese efflux pump MntP [Oceanirhabdus sp. W0125-5]|uniref:manganese efflux pump MntP n=1 Tax=Oceanirhabdus sp. W0125-5 TaxID=2999116 RepID=UPI0022F2E1C6|nr:manganese efflux pump MntP family protein [Oceanirhabdus sp. W0125-5]WBW95167.1 manganese efflux pump MntP family protein [Oceanirhabdus sp. W0125-5]
MTFSTIFIIAVGLAMDAFAVSITSGITIKKLKVRHALKIALFFGVFQGVMPLIGWALSIKFSDYIESVDHWIAFILLGCIGVKMIREAFDNEEDESKKNPLDLKTLTILSIATSIDALVVGVSFAFLEVNILYATFIIAVITYVICFIGVLIGKKFGELFNKKAEIFGGVILVLMGIKILLEHLGII